MPRNGSQVSTILLGKSELYPDPRRASIPLIIYDLPRRDLCRIADCGQSRTTIALKSALDAPTAPNAVVIGGVEKKIISEPGFQS